MASQTPAQYRDIRQSMLPDTRGRGRRNRPARGAAVDPPRKGFPSASSPMIHSPTKRKKTYLPAIPQPVLNLPVLNLPVLTLPVEDPSGAGKLDVGETPLLEVPEFERLELNEETKILTQRRAREIFSTSTQSMEGAIETPADVEDWAFRYRGIPVPRGTGSPYSAVLKEAKEFRMKYPTRFPKGREGWNAAIAAAKTSLGYQPKPKTEKDRIAQEQRRVRKSTLYTLKNSQPQLIKDYRRAKSLVKAVNTVIAAEQASAGLRIRAPNAKSVNTAIRQIQPDYYRPLSQGGPRRRPRAPKPTPEFTQ